MPRASKKRAATVDAGKSTKKAKADNKALEKMKVAELKAECALVGCSSSGTKAVLIARLKSQGSTAAETARPPLNYPMCKVNKLKAELKARGLSTTGTRDMLVARLEENDAAQNKGSLQDCKAFPAGTATVHPLTNAKNLWTMVTKVTGKKTYWRTGLVTGDFPYQYYKLEKNEEDEIVTNDRFSANGQGFTVELEDMAEKLLVVQLAYGYDGCSDNQETVLALKTDRAPQPLAFAVGLMNNNDDEEGDDHYNGEGTRARAATIWQSAPGAPKWTSKVLFEGKQLAAPLHQLICDTITRLTDGNRYSTVKEE